MRSEPPYNPLDKKNLGDSVAEALLGKPLGPLPPTEPFKGAGVYALYYKGNFPAYEPISMALNPNREVPIYVGKAIPQGARKGGVGLESQGGRSLSQRLSKHAESIRQAKNLDLQDFVCRYLVVDDIWIPLGESLLIQRFSPVWNCILDGFGNNDPGKGRHQGQTPPWDVLHPGRDWAKKLQPNKKTPAELSDLVVLFLNEDR